MINNYIPTNQPKKQNIIGHLKTTVCPKFLVLHGLPLNKYIPTYLSRVPLSGIWVDSRFLFASLQTMLSTFSHMSSWYMKKSVSPVSTFRSRIFGLKNRCTFHSVLIVFPGVYGSYSPTRRPRFSTGPPALGVVTLAVFCLSGRCEIVSH